MRWSTLPQRAIGLAQYYVCQKGRNDCSSKCKEWTSSVATNNWLAIMHGLQDDEQIDLKGPFP